MYMLKHTLVIIGSGPAGYTAALYASRAQLSPLLIEGTEPGGQLMLTTEVENYPGFPDGMMGPQMMQLFRAQAERFGTVIKSGMVTSVDFSSRPFKLTVGEEVVEAESVIVATGAQAKWLDVPGEKEYQGRGVSACATCDGFFFKEKNILVVGGGDSAMEEAMFLTRFATHVTVIVRSDTLRASKIMAARAEKNEKISFVWNTQVQEVVGDGTKMTGAKLMNSKTQEMTEMTADGLFVAIGHKPNADLFEGQLDRDEKGYLKHEPDSTRTKIPGVFVAGDVADSVYRQAVTAAGMGCAAALEAERWLAANE